LEDKGRYFELAKRLHKNGVADPYYGAVLASRFGNERSAIAQLSIQPATPRKHRRIHKELGAAHLRLGQYRQAASALEQALRILSPRIPEYAGLENMRLLAESLRDLEPQTIRFQGGAPLQAVRNPGGTWDVPVEVNGNPASWVFDTGANISVIVESEAARLGIPVWETKASVKGSTGERNSMKLAVAKTLRFGSAHLGNVVMLVLPDAALHFPQFNFQVKGFLGLPVIRALECVGISAQGSVQIGESACLPAGRPNLFFEDLALIVDASHRGQGLQMLLDSGANTTDLYPSSRSTLKGVRRETNMEETGGAGKTFRRKVQNVPAIELALGGKTIPLRDITLLDNPPGKSACRDGLLGMDAFNSGFKLDFKTMQFRLD
jgi:hypothetical protein